MTKIADYGRGVEIWHDSRMDEYYVYGATVHGDPRVCPSEDMARSIAAHDGCFKAKRRSSAVVVGLVPTT